MDDFATQSALAVSNHRESFSERFRIVAREVQPGALSPEREALNGKLAGVMPLRAAAVSVAAHERPARFHRELPHPYGHGKLFTFLPREIGQDGIAHLAQRCALHSPDVELPAAGIVQLGQRDDSLDNEVAGKWRRELLPHQPVPPDAAGEWFNGHVACLSRAHALQASVNKQLQFPERAVRRGEIMAAADICQLHERAAVPADRDAKTTVLKPGKLRGFERGGHSRIKSGGEEENETDSLK